MKLKKLVASILATTLVGTTMAFASMPMSASAETVPDTYTATLNGQFNQSSFWKADGPSCTVNGDGQYSLTYTYTGEDGEVTADSMCLILLLDFNTYSCVESGDVIESGITLDINSITLADTNLNYSGSCVAPSYRHADDGSTIKLNIHNVWDAAQRTEAITVPSEIHNGDKLVVDFNVNGLTSAIAKAKELNGETAQDTEAEATTVNTDNSEVTTEATTTSDTSSTTTTDGSTTTTASTTTSSNSSDNSTTTVANNSADTNSSNDSDDDATEDTATATGDTRSTGIVLCFALVSACTGAIAMRKKH
ncbi:MAG: hypothetical protein ACI4WH_03965 [Oscillospiraceae bacterium]